MGAVRPDQYRSNLPPTAAVKFLKVYEDIVEIQSLIPVDTVGVFDDPANRRHNHRNQQERNKPEPGTLLRMGLVPQGRQLLFRFSRNRNMSLLLRQPHFRKTLMVQARREPRFLLRQMNFAGIREEGSSRLPFGPSRKTACQCKRKEAR